MPDLNAEFPPSTMPLGSEPSLLELVTPLVRRWSVLLSVPMVFGLLAGGAAFLLPPLYTSQATFVPESSSGPGLPDNLASLVGLASQFGITTRSRGTFSPDFFAGVLKSRELLEATLQTDFSDFD